MIPCLAPLDSTADFGPDHRPRPNLHTPTPERVRQTLARWAAAGWLRPLDAAFAGFLWQQQPTAHPLLILAAALASHQLGRGHVCLDLQATLDNPALALSLPPQDSPHTRPTARLSLPSDLLAGVQLADWLEALRSPSLVADAQSPHPSPHPSTSPADNTPLVLCATRLYLRRYWHYETQVGTAIERRLQASIALAATLDTQRTPAEFRAILDRLFPPPDSPAAVRLATPSDWPKLACALMARTAFGILTGGPGSGKTTTVVKLLALLQLLALSSPEGRALRIRLAAPTGKAAARLNESIASKVAQLALDGLEHGEAARAAIPLKVSTLHRLLGTRPDTRRFRHHAGNPLALDVLVVDEASMVDLEMMAATLDALPTNARLILLGDKDQLASVEAGAVLGELCARAAEAHYTPATRDWLSAVSGLRVPDPLLDPAGHPLDQAIAMLRHSHRFRASSGIGQLADAVRCGDPSAVSALLLHPPSADLARIQIHSTRTQTLERLFVEGRPPAREAGLNSATDSATHLAPQAASDPGFDIPSIAQGYRHYLECLRDTQPTPGSEDSAYDAWAHKVLSAHGHFQVLCALRAGPWGVRGLNQRISRALFNAGLIPAHEGEHGDAWYPGRPVLVTRNDYGLGLMNGDIGITLPRHTLQKPTVSAANSRGEGDEGHREDTTEAATKNATEGTTKGATEGAAAAPSQPGAQLRVVFPSADGSARIRWILPSRLQDVETVFALTVHKSQGSEFDHVALVLPATPNPILTRELLYTGITRARKHLTLIETGAPEILPQAVQHRVLRASGLHEKFGSTRYRPASSDA